MTGSNGIFEVSDLYHYYHRLPQADTSNFGAWGCAALGVVWSVGFVLVVRMLMGV